MKRNAAWSGLKGSGRLEDRAKVSMYIDVTELRRRCAKTRVTAKRNANGDTDEEWPVDIGHLTAVALAEVGLDTSKTDVLVNLYGPAPPPTDAIWTTGMRIQTPDTDVAGDHQPRVSSSIIIDSITYAHDLLRSGDPGTFVFVSEDVDAAVNKVAGRGFDAHLWSWDKVLREHYREIRLNRVHVHAIECHPDLNIHGRNTDA